MLAISSEPLNSIVAGPSLMNNNQAAAPAAHCHDNKEISTSKLEINWGILTQAIKDSRRVSATEATRPFQFSFVVQASSPGKRNSIKKKKIKFFALLPEKQERCSVTFLFVFSLNSFKGNLLGLLPPYPGTETLQGRTAAGDEESKKVVERGGPTATCFFVLFFVI